MKTHHTIAAAVLTLTAVTVPAGTDLPRMDKAAGSARAYTENDKLTVTTGPLARTWKWTGEGFATVEIRNSAGKVIAGGVGSGSDWDLGDLGNGKLVSLKAFRDDDEHFTSEHLAVEAEVDYGRLQLKYVIWAYSGAPGLRTQLWLKAPARVSGLGPGISEQLAVSGTLQGAFVWGYEAGLKANVTPYEILTKEPLADHTAARLRNGLICQSGSGGLILVKESHVTTHIRKGGLATGDFRREGSCFLTSGLGMMPADVAPEYKFCWANWIIPYAGGEQDAQLALKRFDRFRYPVHPKRDVFIMSNTWGSEDQSDQCCFKAREENVLREIDVCAELGVDILQIDDGWQVRKPTGDGRPAWAPAAKGPTRKYRGKTPPALMDGTTMPASYDVYPNGFGRVREHAKEAGVRLGLWHAWTAPAERIKANYDDGDFKSFKLDFAQLNSKKALDSLYEKARDLIQHAGYTAVVNWDVTESAARMGFYFGRDCGNLYLSNRKSYTVRPAVLYDPWQVLRDAWELAEYMNLNKIQITYQNKDLTPPKARSMTDAWKYTHAYNLAVTLMASPIFFTETQLLSAEARAELKPIIARYKAERDEMYKGYVFAIGDKPDNGSWTGFQNHNPETGNGYLTVFRELNNTKPSARIHLHFLKPGTKLELTDVLAGKSRGVTLSVEGDVEFAIPTAPGFLFLRYTGGEPAERP